MSISEIRKAQIFVLSIILNKVLNTPENFKHAKLKYNKNTFSKPSIYIAYWANILTFWLYMYKYVMSIKTSGM